ncbi:SDR family NAD(P)-dependent oxidoreductase [Sphingomonas sp. SUN039]|uniref:SDR family NAD(P)-dependent oxidoreductase n=1 Tax=Sphingomonas sp. SUN039 TaxID=2937787 RepID=UPI0021641DBE|nr:SDR family oxidoreductase [Sphingomonas sp. SUN039]UVO55757.1 SDR family oxidoreductase [Sphingomonas sp. SUN039]
MGMPGDMTGKVALVTGAAGGLGRATAIALAEAGAQVCIVDLNADGLAETAATIGDGAFVHVADLSRPETCAPAVAAAVARFGRLDALCNVAGVLKLANAHQMALADWNLVIAVNLTAPFLLCQAAIPHLLKTNGSIVNVSSLAAHIGEAYAAAYCASKGGLSQMTKALAMEYMMQPIRINAISPGGMATPIGASFVPPEGADMALLARFRPMRGLVEVEDMARMIAYLASDAASGFHGADIQMDKGITAG